MSIFISYCLPSSITVWLSALFSNIETNVYHIHEGSFGWCLSQAKLWATCKSKDLNKSL